LGETEFFGLEFKADKDVFIPRPDTEILVETVIDIVKVSKCQSVKVLDLGTGSGCIAVSLARFLPNVGITATDISDKAIKLAKSNARLNNVAEKITFIQSDLFSDLEFRISDFDVIVSNPPYIPTAEIAYLQSEIQYEPIIALDGGSDGLDFYRRIISNSPYYLKEEGFLIMEMGFNQVEDIKNIFKELGNFEIIEVVKDYNNIDRVMVTQVRTDG
jgi:release factor glutamine methyltransferase